MSLRFPYFISLFKIPSAPYRQFRKSTEPFLAIQSALRLPITEYCSQSRSFFSSSYDPTGSYPLPRICYGTVCKLPTDIPPLPRDPFCPFPHIFKTHLRTLFRKPAGNCGCSFASAVATTGNSASCFENQPLIH